MYNILVDAMAKQISVSDEVYELLLKRKGKKSFSQVIKENLGHKEDRVDIRDLAGILQNDKGKLEGLKAQIAEEREKNYGREFD